jgi:hypothetical protein
MKGDKKLLFIVVNYIDYIARGEKVGSNEKL